MQLKQEDDEMSQLDALSRLNELLSISNEESLSMFPLDQLIPTLVRSTTDHKREPLCLELVAVR